MFRTVISITNVTRKFELSVGLDCLSSSTSHLSCKATVKEGRGRKRVYGGGEGGVWTLKYLFQYPKTLYISSNMR